MKNVNGRKVVPPYQLNTVEDAITEVNKLRVYNATFDDGSELELVSKDDVIKILNSEKGVHG